VNRDEETIARLKAQLAEMTTKLSIEVMLRQQLEAKLEKREPIEVKTKTFGTVRDAPPSSMPVLRQRKVDTRRRPDEPPEEQTG
jgi:hypothetical protein